MQTSISQFWRKNISTSEPIELANLLRALRKVAGHIGQNVGTIEYAGMSRSNNANIIIEPAMIMGRYPVPPEKMDNQVGIVVHLALHQTQWSEHVWKILETDFQKMKALERVGFQKVIHAGEDIYVDQIAHQNIFGLYVKKVREHELKEIRAKLRQDIESLDKLVYLWQVAALGPESLRDIDPAYEKWLSVLMDLSEKLKHLGQLQKGITDKCKKRADLYLETWEALNPEISSLKIINKMLFWYSSPTSPPRKTAPEQTKQKAQAPLPPELMNEIELHLAASDIDITPIIRSAVDSDEEEIVPTARWDFYTSAHPIVDKRMVSRLKAIFMNYAGQNKMTSRGLQAGKVDSRRLYRAPVSGRCFQETFHIPDLDWSVTLLMDASGSMKGSKWKMVENTVANLHWALKGYRNRLQAFAYFERDGILMISQLLKENRLLSVPPNGLTASGQALIAAAYLMGSKRKRNILIHVTDGESNFGCDVQYGIDYCKKQNIHLITLGCGYKDKDVMHKQYGKTIQFLDHFGQLPQAIERLLKWTFLYGRVPI